MGRRGPAPTPTAILKARGSRRAKERKNEPQPPPSSPSLNPPAWLDGEARDHWNLLAGQLAEIGVLKHPDEPAFARYCHLWARWRKLERTIAEYGETSSIETKHGSYEQQRPEVGIANKLMVLLARLEAEFGLTPASRTRIPAAMAAITNDKKTVDTNPITAMLDEDDDEGGE